MRTTNDRLGAGRRGGGQPGEGVHRSHSDGGLVVAEEFDSASEALLLDSVALLGKLLLVVSAPVVIEPQRDGASRQPGDECAGLAARLLRDGPVRCPEATSGVVLYTQAKVSTPDSAATIASWISPSRLAQRVSQRWQAPHHHQRARHCAQEQGQWPAPAQRTNCAG